MGACREFCVGFSKCIIIFLNLLVLTCAIAMIATAAVHRSQVAGMDMKGVSSFAIGLGVVVGLIALFGCCGAIRENSCMLTTYAGILLTLFIIQLTLGILAFVAAGSGEEPLKMEFSKHLGTLYNSTEEKARETIDNLQTSLHCCGLEGPNGMEVHLPTGLMKSCCDLSLSKCTEEEAYKEGCVTELAEIFVGSIVLIGVISIIFAIFELVVAIFAFCIRGNIRKDSMLLA